jgi:hypothetical protein
MGPGLSANRPNAITAWIAEQIAKLGGGRTAVTPTVTSQRAPTVTPTFTPMQAPTMYGPSTPGVNPNVNAYQRSEAKHGPAPEIYGSVPPSAGATGEPTMEDLMALLGMAGMGGGGTDNSLGWANLDLQREQMAQQQAQFAASLAQAAEIERQRREQQQREMAAAMGQFLAGQQSQNWNNALPYRLPSGTQYAPGFEPGGAANRLAQIAQAAYTAPKLAVSNPPSRGDMEKWLEDAIKRFGPQ